MQHRARGGAAVGRVALPGVGGGGDQHLPAGGADAAQRVPVERGGEAAAGELGAILLGIVVRLLDPDVLPGNIQLLGDQHRQHGLDALADLRVLGDDGDDAVRGDLHIGVQRRQVAGGRAHARAAGDRHGGARSHRDGEAQQHTAAGGGAGLQEGAARGARRVETALAGGGVLGAFVQHDQALVSAVGRPAAFLMAARMRV